MSNPVPAEEAPQTSTDVMFQGILALLLPFFLPSAYGDVHAAGMTIIHLIEAFNAATPRELDLAGQIVILSSAATDSLQRSMTPDLPDNKVLGYRASAVSLTRSAARLQKTLDTLQKSRDPSEKPIRAFIQEPAPTEQPTPQAANPRPNQAAEPVPSVAPRAPSPQKTIRPPGENQAISAPMIEKMQLDAHTAIKTLQTQNASLTSVAFPAIPDPAMAAKAAAHDAMAGANHKAAAPPG